MNEDINYVAIEKHCRECLELYVLSRARAHFFSKFTIITAIVGLCVLSLVEVAQALIFGLAHRIIEAELFLFGKSGLIVDFDFYLLQAWIVLWISQDRFDVNTLNVDKLISSELCILSQDIPSLVAWHHLLSA